MINPELDGINHINIYSKAQTELGRKLSNWHNLSVTCCLGKFQCIEGLIFYLGSFDEKLRRTNGYESKIYGEKVDRNIRLPDDVFKRIIKEAMIDKVNKCYEIKKGLLNTNLPLTHYYNYKGKVIEIPKWNWQVIEWENIRKNLKNGDIF